MPRRRPRPMYGTLVIIAHAIEVVAESGAYVRSSEPGSTKDAIEARLKAGTMPAPESLAEAREVREWGRALRESSDFNISLRRACTAETSAAIGVLAYAPTGRKRDAERAEERAAERAAEQEAGKASDFIGSIGERFSGAVEVIRAIYFRRWERTLVKMRTVDGDIITAFARPDSAPEEGTRIEFRGTVNKHETRDGVRQTSCARPYFKALVAAEAV